MEENEAILETHDVPGDFSYRPNWTPSHSTSQHHTYGAASVSGHMTTTSARPVMLSPHMNSPAVEDGMQFSTLEGSMMMPSAPFRLDTVSRDQLPLMHDSPMYFAQPVHPMAPPNNLQSSGVPAHPGDAQQPVPGTEDFVDLTSLVLQITQSPPLPGIPSDMSMIMPSDAAMSPSPMDPSSQSPFHPHLTLAANGNPQATNKVVPHSSFAGRRSSIPAALFRPPPGSMAYPSQESSSASLMTPTLASFSSQQSSPLSVQSPSEHIYMTVADEYRELRRRQSHSAMLDKAIMSQTSPVSSAYASLPASASHIPHSNIARPPLHSSLSSPTASVRRSSSSTKLVVPDEDSNFTSTFRIRTEETKEAAPACDFCRRRKVRVSIRWDEYC